MHFHPKDTKEAYKPASKEKISHLWYHLHYNQMIKDVNKKTGKVEYVAKRAEKAPAISSELKNLARQVEEQRQRAFIELSDFYHVRQLRAASISRIIHGLGGGHVREAGLTLHPVYGVPYIPASSVKGLVRNWFIQAYCDGKEERLQENKWGSLVFGSQEQRGIVQFYDIFLHESLRLEADIMSVHFQDYYSGKDAATDYGHNIIPVTFWTVNVKEANIFLTMKKEHLPSVPDEEALKLAAAWTGQALTELGIGSKTSLGYGLFSEVTDVTEEEIYQLIIKHQKQKEEEREEQLRLQKEQEEKARLEAMTEEERLVYEIESLSDSQADQELSKTRLYNEVIEQNNQAAAAALKAYWVNTGDWNVKKQKKKQYEKVQKIKEILGG